MRCGRAAGPPGRSRFGIGSGGPVRGGGAGAARDESAGLGVAALYTEVSVGSSSEVTIDTSSLRSSRAS